MISIKIKDPIFIYCAQLITILAFNPKKVSIEKVCAINDELERIYYVKYSGYPFYLVIDDLKGCFKYSEEKRLGFVIEDQKKRKIYNQIWDRIKELINSIDCVGFRFYEYSRDYNVIRFDTDDTLPLDTMINIDSMTIVIRSVYRTCFHRFYPQIHLVSWTYKKCQNTIELIFLKVLILKNVKKHLENAVYVNFIIS